MKTETLRSIMKLAWNFVKNFNMTMSEALKLAWKNIKLYKALSGKIVEFEFKKLDGTIRKAKGTINVEILTSTNSVPCGVRPYTKNPNHQAFFDVEKKQWRSFDKSNLIQVIG